MNWSYSVHWHNGAWHSVFGWSWYLVVVPVVLFGVGVQIYCSDWNRRRRSRVSRLGGGYVSERARGE